jgi:hypothetical protein
MKLGSSGGETKGYRKSSLETASSESSRKCLGIDEVIYAILGQFLIEAKICTKDYFRCEIGQKEVINAFLKYSLTPAAFEEVMKRLNSEPRPPYSLTFEVSDLEVSPKGEGIEKRVMTMVLKEIYSEAEECYQKAVESRMLAKVGTNKIEGPLLMMRIFYFEETLALQKVRKAKSMLRGVVDAWAQDITNKRTDFRLANRILALLKDEKRMIELAERKIRRALHTLLKGPSNGAAGLSPQQRYQLIIKKITDCKVSRPGKKHRQDKKPKLPKAIILMPNAILVTRNKFLAQIAPRPKQDLSS